MANERLLFYRCSQRGSPSVLGQGEDGRHYVVPSRPVFFQTCPATRRQGQVPHRPRGETSHSSRPAAPRSPRQSPAVSASHPQSPYSLVLTVTGYHSLLSCSFCVLFFTPWYYIYCYRIVSFVFGVFPYHSISPAVTRFGLMELEMEIQLMAIMDTGVVRYGDKRVRPMPFLRQKWTFLNKQFSTCLYTNTWNISTS